MSSRLLGFHVLYQKNDFGLGEAKGSDGKKFVKTQFIPLTAVEIIYQVEGGYWRLKTLAGNTYYFGTLEDGVTPKTPTIEELSSVVDCTNSVFPQNKHEQKKEREKLFYPHYPDSPHEIVTEVTLPNHGVLHRFTNPAGVPYSAIYVGNSEKLSCQRDHEEGMIRYWNEQSMIP